MSNYGNIDNSTLRKHMDTESEESKEVLIMSTLYVIVDKKFRTKISDGSAKTSMRRLFASYRTILRLYGSGEKPKRCG